MAGLPRNPIRRGRSAVGESPRCRSPGRPPAASPSRCLGARGVVDDTSRLRERRDRRVPGLRAALRARPSRRRSSLTPDTGRSIQLPHSRAGPSSTPEEASTSITPLKPGGGARASRWARCWRSRSGRWRQPRPKPGPRRSATPGRGGDAGRRRDGGGLRREVGRLAAADRHVAVDALRRGPGDHDAAVDRRREAIAYTVTAADLGSRLRVLLVVRNEDGSSWALSRRPTVGRRPRRSPGLRHRRLRRRNPRPRPRRSRRHRPRRRPTASGCSTRRPPGRLG